VNRLPLFLSATAAYKLNTRRQIDVRRSESNSARDRRRTCVARDKAQARTPAYEVGTLIANTMTSASAAERDEEGCWVSYGRRDGLRRLPPPIPSSVGRLARARTSDGHLVISPEKCDAVAHRVSGRKAEGRLVLRLPESGAAPVGSRGRLRGGGGRWHPPVAAVRSRDPRFAH
jgi:hypothetical protein